MSVQDVPACIEVLEQGGGAGAHLGVHERFLEGLEGLAGAFAVSMLELGSREIERGGLHVRV